MVKFDWLIKFIDKSLWDMYLYIIIVILHKMDKIEATYKIVVLGESSAGKTSLKT